MQGTLLCAVGFPASQGIAREPEINVFDRAKKVVAHGYNGEDWLNDKEVLDYRYAHGGITIVRRNVFTGVEKPLGTILSQADKDPQFPEVSPNRKRLLWKDSIDRYFATTVGRKHKYYLPKGLNAWATVGNLIWRGDSRHWLHFIWDDQDTHGKQLIAGPSYLAIGDIYHPKRYRMITVLMFSPLYRVTSSAFDAVMLTPDIMLVPEPHLGEVTFWMLSLRQYAMPTRSYSVQLPENWTWAGFQITRRHDRIAWKLRRLHGGKVVAESLWVSRIHGSHMTEIGEIPIRDERDMLSGPFWLSDGRHLGFGCHGAFYIVPVGKRR